MVNLGTKIIFVWWANTKKNIIVFYVVASFAEPSGPTPQSPYPDSLYDRINFSQKNINIFLYLHLSIGSLIYTIHKISCLHLN